MHRMAQQFEWHGDSDGDSRMAGRSNRQRVQLRSENEIEDIETGEDRWQRL